MHEEYPHHQRLEIHLPDEQTVYFRENVTIDQILAQRLRSTTLTAWFEINRSDSSARQYLYSEFPEHYVWTRANKSWKARTRSNIATIGGIYSISPRRSELYHLRILPHHVRGAEGYQSLRTVNGTVYATFKEAAKAMNLLQTDDEWERCMTEASVYQMPVSLRSLLATILLFCKPTEPFQLWMNHRDAMCEDYLHRYRTVLNDPEFSANEDIYNCALLNIEDTLFKNGQSLADCGEFVVPTTDNRHTGLEDILLTGDELALPRMIRDQLILNRSTSSESIESFHFNESQLSVFNSIVCLVTSADIFTPKIAFVDGPGGTGKTYLFNCLLNYVRSNRDLGGISLAVASSGTAALLLKGGTTAHSRFKIPLTVDGHTMCSIKPNSPLALLIRSTKLIVWDEASMISKNILEAVDRTFKDICKVTDPTLENVPFGGKVVIFGGDFRQVLPVIPKGKKMKL